MFLLLVGVIRRVSEQVKKNLKQFGWNWSPSHTKTLATPGRHNLVYKYTVYKPTVALWGGRERGRILAQEDIVDFARRKKDKEKRWGG